MKIPLKANIILATLLCMSEILGAQNFDFNKNGGIPLREKSRVDEKKNSMQVVTVQLKNKECYDQLKDVKTETWIKGRYPALKMVTLVIPKDKNIDSLIFQDCVKSYHLRHQPPEANSYIDKIDQSVNDINQLVEVTEFKGLEQYIYLKEKKPLLGDPDIMGRVVISPIASEEADLHGNDMATIMGGNGQTFYTSLGILPEVKFISTDFLNLLPDPINTISDQPIKIQNHSYGVGIENFYGLEAVAYDDQQWKNPEILHVFSAGNSGSAQVTGGPFGDVPGYSTITGTFKMSKNNLVVGAVDSFKQVVELSSKGPAYDGRIKPEVVAFGYDGSSGAAAIASGTATMLREIIMENGDTPRSDLLKAIIINSAEDIGILGPDYASGFGNLSAYDAYLTAVNKHYFHQVTEVDTHQFTIEVPEGASLLKVGLAWVDMPAELENVKGLISDLDLRVDGGNEVSLPLVLNPFGGVLTPPVQGKDTLNNVEQVYIENPVAGTYMIKVITNAYRNIPFSVSWDVNKKEDFTWTYPTRSDFLIGGEKNILRWKSSFLSPPQEITITDVSGGNVDNILIDINEDYAAIEGIEDGQRIFITAIVDNLPFQSDTISVFDILQKEFLSICEEEIIMQIKGGENADAFILEQVDGSERIFLGEYPSNQINFSGNVSDETLLAVKGIYEGSLGPASIATSLISEVVGCGLDDISLQENSGILDIRLLLYSVQNLTSLDVYKIGVEERILSSFLPPSSINLNTKDQELIPGVNEYRIDLTFVSGKVESRFFSYFYIPDGEVLLLPNIAKSGEELRLYREEAIPGYIEIINASGKVILKEALFSGIERYDTSEMAPGKYYFRILNENADNVINTGAFVVIR